MTSEVVLTPAAAREQRRMDPLARHRVQAAVELLADDPRPPGAVQLVGGAGEWRVRTGAYRVVYEIQDSRLLVLVLRAGHRREVYRR